MSETVHFVGKLTPVEIVVDAETTAMRILTEMNEELDLPYYKTALRQLEVDGYKKYQVIKGRIYKVEMREQDPDADIANAALNADGSYSFEVRYYNGGCSFTEAIDEAIGRIA